MQRSVAELEQFPSDGWDDVAPRLFATDSCVRLEHVLERQDGACLTDDERYALAGCEGADLARRSSSLPTRCVATGRQYCQLRRQPQHQFHEHLFCRMQVLRLQPRASREPTPISIRSKTWPAEAKRRGSGRDRSLHPGRPAARSALLLSRHSACGEERRPGRCTFTPFLRWRSSTASNSRACRCATI